jgi:hypothetical protein
MDLNSPKIGQIQLYRPGDLPRFRQKSAHRTQAQKRAIDLLGELGGDSGGPAFVMIQGEPYVAGIASGYDDLGYATYENVPNDADWITANMDELEATSIATK